MKKVLLLFLFVASILLVGCVDTEMVMKINKDKSINYNNQLLMNKDVLNDEEKENLDESFKNIQEEYEEYGYVVEMIDKDKKIGLNMKKNFKNINSLSDYNEEDIVFHTNVKKDKKLLYEKYDVSIKIRGTSISGPLSQTLPMNAPDFNADFIIELPYKVNDSNATTVDGKVLKWDLSYEVVEPTLSFSYNHYYDWAKYVVIGVGVLAILIIGLIIFLIKRRRY